MTSRTRTILISLNVALLTWLGAVLTGSLLYVGTMTMLMSPNSSSFGSAVITMFVLVLGAALISLVVMIPFNFLILLAATRMPTSSSNTLRHFFLLGANIIVTPAALAISPFVRPSMLPNISQLSLLAGLIIGLIFISLIVVKRGYKASSITLTSLGTIMYFVFFFLSAYKLPSSSPWADTWIYLGYQVPSMILLSALTHKFKLLST